jgi:hypothetical protein
MSTLYATSSTTSTNPTLVLSSLTGDIDQFVQQFQAYLQTTPTWVGNLTTQTSETLIELISSVGVFAQGRLIRESEDAFAETAQSDSAILAITQMQGLRIARYLPAGVTTTLTSPIDVSLPPLTQFSGGGSYFFNRDQLTFVAGVPLAVTLFQGQVYSYAMNGLGTERQTFVGSQDAFVVSDQDVIVEINGTIIPKAYGGLWNFDGLPGYADITLSDGRLLLQFGNLGGTNAQFTAIPQFGTIPQVNDTVIISYPVTTGDSGNSLVTMGQNVTVTGYPTITGTFTGNPTGGASGNPIVAYKNVAAGGFGTYSSAVTKSQYQAIISTYPGIIDAVTQAQREINPMDVTWMNIIRVSALTTSPWTQAQIQDFTDYCQTVTMYSTYFLWQNPVAVPNDIVLDVYIFNSALPAQVEANVTAAIQNLFAPRPGILMTDFYVSDLVSAALNSSPGMISYVIPVTPTTPMVVSAPPSPQITYTLEEGMGTLGELVYAYAVSTTLMNGEVGIPSNWVFPQVVTEAADYAITLTWPAVSNAESYQIWGRVPGTTTLGMLASVPATTLTYTDMGTTMPTGTIPTSTNFPIQYNSLGTLTVNVAYSARQQQIDPNSVLPTRLSNG